MVTNGNQTFGGKYDVAHTDVIYNVVHLKLIQYYELMLPQQKVRFKKSWEKSLFFSKPIVSWQSFGEGTV